MARRVLVLFVAAVLALSACGEGDSDVDSRTGGDSGTTANENSDENAVRSAIAAFERRARADGFALDTDDDEEDDDFEFTSDECKRFEEAFPDDDEGLPGATFDLDSKSFTRGDLGPGGGAEESLEASAGFVETEENLDAIFGLLRDPRMKSCLTEAFDAGFRQSAEREGSDISLTDLVVDLVDISGVGDQATSFRMNAVIGVQGLEFPFALDFSFARQGRAAASVSASIVGSERLTIPVDDHLRQILGDLAVSA